MMEYAFECFVLMSSALVVVVGVVSEKTKPYQAVIKCPNRDIPKICSEDF